jgi:hypothetical protein
LELPSRERVAHGEQHAIPVEWLLEEIGRAELHRLHRLREGGVAGHHQHGKLSGPRPIADLLERLDAAHLWKANVEDDEVHLVALERLQTLLG